MATLQSTLHSGRTNKCTSSPKFHSSSHADTMLRCKVTHHSWTKKCLVQSPLFFNPSLNAEAIMFKQTLVPTRHSCTALDTSCTPVAKRPTRPGWPRCLPSAVGRPAAAWTAQGSAVGLNPPLWRKSTSSPWFWPKLCQNPAYRHCYC